MPISSTDISALTGGFNNQVMLGMQHSAMITAQAGGYAPNPAFSPVPTAGQNISDMMMMSGGRAGMGMAGAFGGAPVLGGAISSFGSMGMGQMMYGAQQQSMLESNLRQSFRHPNQFGGRGFAPGQLQTIGADLRQMALERGSGGEMVGFEELGRLASNMGRMGMAENVRGVKDFSEKFREMLKTVKTVAQELGTSLEEAQQTMAAMKGSGIFSGQGKFAGSIRAGALSGNLATSELTGAAFIGSQISRSVGGLGRSGAQAGVNTMAGVGSAIQSGILSEEDIYNATGLTGAAGRQAYSMTKMQHDASFAKSGLGRRMLAAVAGKDGTLDEESVQRFLGGGVGTEDTMRMAHANLGKVGRANFIRNEGRLRGEAMRAFGGNMKAIAAKNWLEERGLNLSEMDDRSMLFFQQKFGVGRDEADNFVKEVRGLDQTMAQQRRSASEDQYSKDLDQADRRSSPAEVMRQFEHAREQVNAKLRQFGADARAATAGLIDNAVKKISGDFVRRVDRSLGPAIESIKKAQLGSDEVLAREFGIGSGAGLGLKEGMAAADKMFGGGEVTQQSFDRFRAANFSGFKAAGYDISKAGSPDAFRALEKSIRNSQLSALTGLVDGKETGGTRAATDLLGGAREQIRAKLAVQGLSGRGDELLQNAGEFIKSIEGGQALAARYATASREERAAIVGKLATGAGARELVNRMAGPKTVGRMGGGTFATEEAESFALGDMGLRGLKDPTRRAGSVLEDPLRQASLFAGDNVVGRFLGKGADAAKGLGGSIDSLMEGIRTGGGIQKIGGMFDKAADFVGGGGIGDFIRQAGRRTEALLEGAVGGFTSGDRTAVGEFLQAREGKDLMQGAFSGRTDVRAATREKLQKRLLELQGKDAMTQSEKAEMMASKGMLGRQARLEWQLKNPNKTPSKKDLEEIAANAGFSNVDEMLQLDGMVGTAHGKVTADAQRQMFSSLSDGAKRELSLMNEQAPAIAEAKKKGDITGAGSAYLQKLRQIRELRAGMTGIDLEADQMKFDESQRLQEQLNASGDFKSVEDKMKLAKQLRAAGETDQAADIERAASIEGRLARANKRGSGRSTVAQMLGIDIGSKDLKGTAGGAARAAFERSGIAGLDIDEGTKAQIKEQLSSAFNGDKSVVEQRKVVESLMTQHGDVFQKGRQALQDNEAKERDPSFRKLTEIKDEIGKGNKAVVDALGAVKTAVYSTKEDAGSGETAKAPGS